MSQFEQLTRAVTTRSNEWDSEVSRYPLFRAVELGGEAGEALNEVKKLVREASGIAGSTSTKEKLASELADVLICTARLAVSYDIDLWLATCTKFNETSEKYGLVTRLDLYSW